MVEISKLSGSLFNSPERIEPKNIKDLVESMKKDGFWNWMPIITGNDGRVADGHRRLAAAAVVGIEKVPVERVNIETAVLWANINLMHRRMKTREIASAYQSGARSAIDHLPNIETTKTLRKIIAIGGEELLRKVVETKTSPNIIIRARWVANYCGEGTDEFVVRAANWLMDNDMSATVNFYIRSKLSSAQLYKAIVDDKPIVLIPTIV
jgi:hypothetical protein